MADEETEPEETEGTSEESAEEEAAPEGGGKRKWILLALVGAVVLIGGAAGTFFLVAGGDEGEVSEEAHAEETDEHGGDDAEAEDAAPSEFLPLEPVVVNIRDRDKDRYLKLTAEVELSAPALAAELEKRRPQIRDVVISLLGAQTFDEIRTIEGKNRLREELMTRINAHLQTGRVQRVYFTEFVVQ